MRIGAPALALRSWRAILASAVLLAWTVTTATPPAFAAPPPGGGVPTARKGQPRMRKPGPPIPVPFAMVSGGFARLPQDSPFVLRGRSRPALRALPFRATKDWKAFWAGVDKPAPPLDLGRFSVLVALGRPGSAEVGVASLVRQGRRMTATLSSPRWPHLDLAPECRPFVVIRLKRGALERVALALREDASSRALDALVNRSRRLPTLPPDELATLTSEKLAPWKVATRSAGHALLKEADTLARTGPGLHRPYALLLHARVARQWMEDDAQADSIEARLGQEFPRSPAARVAQSTRASAMARTLDAAAWPWLETRRMALGAVPRSDPERAPLLLALGLSYEHARTLRPLSLLLAARCYLESGTENGLFRAAEIHDLWFDRDEARSMYGRLVHQSPDSDGVITCLDRVAAIEDDLWLTGGTTRPFRAYLATWPGSPRTAAIRRWLGTRLSRTKPAPPPGKPPRRPPAR